MTTKPKVERYLSRPIFPLVVGLLLIGFGLFGIHRGIYRGGSTLFFTALMFVLFFILSFCGVYTFLYGLLRMDGNSYMDFLGWTEKRRLEC